MVRYVRIFGRRMKVCETCNKLMVDCICPRKRRKLKVYYYFHTRPWEYAYGAAYTKRQFARMIGSNLYILGGAGIEEDPNRIKFALETPFVPHYDPDGLPYPESSEKQKERIE